MCPGIPDLQPDPEDPKVPEGAHLSSCSLGSLSSNLSISKDPVPPALWGTQKNRLPRFSPQGPNPLATGVHSILGSRAPLRNVGSSALAPIQDLEKRSSTFSPLVDARTRVPTLLQWGTQEPGLTVTYVWRNISLCPALPFSPVEELVVPVLPQFHQFRAQNMKRSPLPNK